MDSPPQEAVDRQLQCPSAQPDWRGSRIYGIIGGTPEQPRMAALPEMLEPTPDLLALAKGVRPTEVFRFAAPCARSACQHFEGGKCELVRRIVKKLEVVVEDLPACLIRPTCRWFAQEGGNACMRCPQVVTDRPTVSPLLREVAEPAARRAYAAS